MRFRTGAAVIAAAMLPVFAAPAADAASTPNVTFSFAKGANVDAGSKVTLNYSITNIPKGSHVELRRETGASHTYKVVNTLKAANCTGSVTTTAPTQGRWGYRIFILNSKNQTLALRGHWLYAFKNISIKQLWPGAQHPNTVGVGNRLLAYDDVVEPYDYDIFKTTRNTTCRSISLRFGSRNSYGWGDERTLSVLQAKGAAVAVKFDTNVYKTLTAKLNGSASPCTSRTRPGVRRPPPTLAAPRTATRPTASSRRPSPLIPVG
ncbi:hypothetical protein [Streptomyces sp. LN245]|uniref:hypothetical protein n=1 Tax=Streptomyces sp. LN245 TaxID=3112975 RepID=UPI00371AF484